MHFSHAHSYYVQSGQVHKVTQFQLEQWNEGLCSNPQALVGVIDQMSVIQRRTGNKAIVIHGRYVADGILKPKQTIAICMFKFMFIFSDTVGRVGVFCSVVNAIEMCKTEGVVDVFQVVKALRIQKPGAVLTVVTDY